MSIHRTAYRIVKAEGLSIFYREAGPPAAPVILLLHGFPSSSRMWQPLLDRLAGPFRLIAPEYPGFGHSDAPGPAAFAYTFDQLAAVTGAVTEALGLARYALVVQDYGGPVGFRLAGAATIRPSRSRRRRRTAGTCRTPRCASSTPATSPWTSSRTRSRA
jgi:pimeloyl-ACP methyl ester carboxylesterase